MQERVAAPQAMTPGTPRPGARRLLGEQAAARLRQAIWHGEFAPGVRLVERNLALRFGMSRIPVREAIQKLIEEELVRKVPHQGTFVTSLSQKEIEEILSLRAVLERFAVERAIARITPDHFGRLQQTMDGMRLAAAQADHQGFFELDLQFHQTLWEIADHRALFEMLSGMRSRIMRFLYYEALSTGPEARFDVMLAKHSDILEILKSGDVAAAQLIITQHVLDPVVRERVLAYAGSLADQRVG